MKRTTLIFICLLTTVTAMAQNGLNINRLFDGRYKNSPNATEIIVTGDRAKEIGLTVYHSLCVNNASDGEFIEGLVIKDGVQAVGKEVEYRRGQLYYGFYTMPVTGKGNNRCIFFLNQQLANKSPKQAVTVIYMEGKASPTHIKKLIKK